MEINITKFFMNAEPCNFSASAFELGDNAGKITWGNAKEAAKEYDLLDSPEKVEAFKAHIKDFGAWSVEEINSWPHSELNALFIQCICGDMREDSLGSDMTDEEWLAYEQDENKSGRIFKGTDGEIYYYAGV